MEWQTPQALYLILPLCVGWFALVVYSERRRHAAMVAFAAQPMWSHVLPQTSRNRLRIKLVLQEIAMAAGLLALAGPRFGIQYEQVVPRGSDLYVLIDVSRSMLADDVPPTRLERAKADVSALVNRLDGERIGLIAFAGQAVVKCPLTVDYDSFRRALTELDTSSAPRGGTAIGDAIRKALEVFHAKTERDQAILMITDGDDQESYPLEAASVAAEQQVTIFSVGLGDAETGARIPEKSGASTFVEQDGQQVWSKLDSQLLQEIALKTSGVYIPAGTRAFDLGELYVNHLHGRKGDTAESEQRIRRAERYQIFLTVCLVALLGDLVIRRYPKTGARTSVPRSTDVPEQQTRTALEQSDGKAAPRGTSTVAAWAIVTLLPTIFAAEATAEDPREQIRAGLELYGRQQYVAAGREFAAASEDLTKKKSQDAAVAAFDEACAYHRGGNPEKARDAWLRAGLSQDRSLAVSAHFNLATMLAETARELAGEHPDQVPPDKRPEILDQLKQAITSYRHCLELQRDHAPSRRNLELLRQWIKYYSDRWREIDRQKLRDETNLIQFLEFLIQGESSLRETVLRLPENVRQDAFAELKRVQDELGAEIPVLKEKISNELRPQAPSAGTASSQDLKELEESIALLQSWASQAGDRMDSAARKLSKGDSKSTATEQQAAIDELDRIWDAVVPFPALLQRALADQTAIVGNVKLADDSAAPAESESLTQTTTQSALPGGENKSGSPPPDSDSSASGSRTQESQPGTSTDIPLSSEAATSQSGDPAKVRPGQQIDSDTIDFSAIAESQERTLRKTRLLAPKAEAELNRLENMPARPDSTDSTDSTAGPEDEREKTQIQPDPEEQKAAYRRAIELAPRAVEEMETTIQSLELRNRAEAALHAEAARRILEEIQNSQPKDEQQNQDRQNQDRQKQDEQEQPKSNQHQNEDQQDNQQDEKQKQKQDQSDKEEEKTSDEKQEDHKSDGKNEKQQQQDREQEQSASNQTSQRQVSQDRIEEALRKVRERQQEKRERDRQLRLRVLGRVPVDKDW